MAFDVNGIFRRLFNFQEDRDNNIKILASRMDDEFDNLKDGLDAIVDGTQPSIAPLPVVRTPDGAIDNLAFAFEDQVDTGFYKKADASIRFVHEGVEKLKVSDAHVKVLGDLEVQNDATFEGDVTIDGSILGGFSATTQAGELDWDDESNSRIGMGETVLSGATSDNAPASSAAAHVPFTFGFRDSGRTQFAIPTTGEGGFYFRTRQTNGGSWSVWHEIKTSAFTGLHTGFNADQLDGEHGAYYRNAANLVDGRLGTSRLSGTYNINISGRASTATTANGLGNVANAYHRNAGNMNAGRLPSGRLSGSYNINAATATTADSATMAATAANALLLDGRNQNFLRDADNMNAGHLPRARLDGTYDISITGTSAGGGSGGGTNSNALTLEGSNKAFYRNAANLDAGVLRSGRLSGSYDIDITGDADTLEGSNKAYYRNAANLTGRVSTARLDDAFPYPIDITGNAATATLAATATEANSAHGLGNVANAYHRNADNMNAGHLPRARLDGTYDISITGSASGSGGGDGGDADTLEGSNKAYYRNADNMNAGRLPRARLDGTYDISITGTSASGGGDGGGGGTPVETDIGTFPKIGTGIQNMNVTYANRIALRWNTSGVENSNNFTHTNLTNAGRVTVNSNGTYIIDVNITGTNTGTSRILPSISLWKNGVEIGNTYNTNYDRGSGGFTTGVSTKKTNTIDTILSLEDGDYLEIFGWSDGSSDTSAYNIDDTRSSMIVAKLSEGSSGGDGGDADTLEEHDAAFYRNAGNMNTGILPPARLDGSYDISITGTSSGVLTPEPEVLDEANFTRVGGVTQILTSTYLNVKWRNPTIENSANFTHSNTSNVGRVTVNSAGEYNIETTIKFRLAISSSTIVLFNIYKNGVVLDNILPRRVDLTSSNREISGTLNRTLTLASGDYIEIKARANRSNAVFVEKDAATELIISKLAASGGASGSSEIDTLGGQNSAYYRNAANLNAGNLHADRLSGSYNINAATATLAADASDAELLDGENKAYYLSANNLTGRVSTARLYGIYAYTININGNATTATTATNATTHAALRDNPHGVTKAQVGLSNVDNTSDADKPVPAAFTTSLNNKLDLTGGTLTGDLYLKHDDLSDTVRLGAAGSGVRQGFIEFESGGDDPESRAFLGGATASKLSFFTYGNRYIEFNQTPRVNEVPLARTSDLQLTQKYESGPQYFTPNVTEVFAHGLGVKPKLVDFVLVMRRSVHSFVTGQEVRPSGDRSGAVVWTDTTNVYVRTVGNNGTGVYTVTANGTQAFLRNTDVHMKIYAYL